MEINLNQQQPEYQLDPNQQYDPRLGQPVFPNQDTGFLQWLFSFRKEAIIPLRYIWRGYEFDFQNNRWIKRQDAPSIMNERGITWSISLIESYLNPVYVVSDFDDMSYNFTMRQVSRVIWNSLSVRWKEFDMKKTDIPRVAEEIESKVRAILLGAKYNGYRDFFSTQNQNIETKNLSPPVQMQKPSIFSNMANMFRRQQNMPIQNNQY